MKNAKNIWSKLDEMLEMKNFEFLSRPSPDLKPMWIMFFSDLKMNGIMIFARSEVEVC
jgi:hypothetical protein